jgi:large subunit ribosomal protein L29
MRMKIDEIRQLSDEELDSELERVRRHMFDLHSQAVTEKLEDPTQITKAKRDIARLLTVARQRALSAEAEAAAAPPQPQG